MRKWNEIARTGTATKLIVNRGGTGGSGEGKVIVSSAEPLSAQRVEDIIVSARENGEPRSCRQAARKTYPYGCYYKRVIRGKEVVDCAVLRKLNSMAAEVLRQEALNSKMDELGKEEQKNREELARKSEELETKLEADEKTMARLQKTVRGSGTSQTSDYRT